MKRNNKKSYHLILLGMTWFVAIGVFRKLNKIEKPFIMLRKSHTKVSALRVLDGFFFFTGLHFLRGPNFRTKLSHKTFPNAMNT